MLLTYTLSAQEMAHVSPFVVSITSHNHSYGNVERPTSRNAGNRHVVTADRETGIVDNVMRCSDAYIRKHYK